MRSTVRPAEPTVGGTPWLVKLRSLVRHQLAFIGPGVVAAVAYLDPGNWATDIEAGSSYGYAHLFVIFVAALMAILLQVLSTRLGYVTGRDLAQQCRILLYNRPRHTLFWRWAALYPLYAICELGIIFTDLAELIGSAMAMKMLIPKLPLWAGVILTSLDVFIVLFFFNSYPSDHNKSSIRAFETAISLLVMAVLVLFAILLAKVGPKWSDVFMGFLPSRMMVRQGGLYQAIGIIGATVMPHAMFLGSRVAIVDRVNWDNWDPDADEDQDKASDPTRESGTMANETAGSSSPALALTRTQDRKRAWEAEADPIRYISSHLSHASFDIAFSLFTLALPVNAAILIVSAAAFYYTDGQHSQTLVADLFSAHQLLASRMGEASSYLFAIALLLSGQAASITVTMSGQIVSEGFLEWRTNPVVRRMVTRLIGIVPAAAVAGSVGVKGMDSLLVGSQVALSLVLPFVIGPLLYITSNPKSMSVMIVSKDPAISSPEAFENSTTTRKKSISDPPDTSRPLASEILTPSSLLTPPQNIEGSPTELQASPEERPLVPGPPAGLATIEHTFANKIVIVSLTLTVMVVICAANIYGIIQLAAGGGDGSSSGD